MQNEQLEILEKEVSPIIAIAKSLTITTPEYYEKGANFLKQLKTLQKRVTEYWNPLKTAAHKTHKGICTKEKDMLDPLESAELIIKNKQLTFTREQEAIRRKEELRLQAIEDARAERERQRLFKEAAKLKTPELKEQRLIEAEEIASNVVIVETNVPKVKGQSIKKVWKSRVIDKKAFLAAALKDENLLSFIEIEITKLNKLASSTKGTMKYDGIEFYEESVLSSTGW